MSTDVKIIPPFDIAILGVGRIGSALAFQIRRSGHHSVTGIARPNSTRLAQLSRDQGIVNTKAQHADISIVAALDERVPYDLLIITLLGHQLQSILPSLKRSAAKRILCMFNTFTPENLIPIIGADRIAFGMPFIQADITPSGQLKAKITGAGTQSTILSDQFCVDLFNQSGLPAAFEPDMPLWLRCHAPICVAMESIAIAGHQRGKGASWGEAKVVAEGIRACYMVVRGLGYEVYPKMKKRIVSLPVVIIACGLWALSRVKSFRDLLATGSPECDAIIDEMISAAESKGLAREVVEGVRRMRPKRQESVK